MSLKSILSDGCGCDNKDEVSFSSAVPPVSTPVNFRKKKKEDENIDSDFEQELDRVINDLKEIFSNEQ